MKRILLSALLGLFAIASFGQANIEVTLDKPALNDVITTGTAFDYEITVKNTGTVALSGDTLISIITWNGGYIPTGPTTILGWFELATIAPGASQTFTQTITLSGGQTGQVNVCAEVLNFPNLTDTVKDCNMIGYSNPLSLDDEISESKVQNNSFYANGMFNVAVERAFGHNNATVSIVNINGQTVASEVMDINAGVIDGALNVEHLASGIYIVNIQSSKGIIATQKVMMN